jgi:AraC family transcriptional regulator
VYYSGVGEMTVEAELVAPLATARLVRYVTAVPSGGLLPDENAHRLDLCLSPRPADAGACYPQRWRSDRFERVGDIYFTPLGEAMCGRGGPGRTVSIVQLLRPHALEDWLEGVEWTDRKLEACLNIQNPHIRALLLRLAEETRHPGFASEAMAELIAAQVAIELARHCRGLQDRPASGGLAPWRLRLIEERLNELRTPPSLTELAKLCNISGRQLTRGFRVSRACSIGDYITEKRIANAKRMLAGRSSIKETAHDMGFGSPSSFCYAFRRATGETPGAFQQRAAALA